MQTQEFRSPLTWEGVGPSTGCVYSASGTQRPQRPVRLTGPTSVAPACTPITFALRSLPAARCSPYLAPLPAFVRRAVLSQGRPGRLRPRAMPGGTAAGAAGHRPAQGRTASRLRWCQRARGDGGAGWGRSRPTAAHTSGRTKPGMARTPGAQAAALTFSAGRKGSLPLRCP